MEKDCLGFFMQLFPKELHYKCTEITGHGKKSTPGEVKCAHVQLATSHVVWQL
jgi:hypothetical protein